MRPRKTLVLRRPREEAVGHERGLAVADQQRRDAEEGDGDVRARCGVRLAREPQRCVGLEAGAVVQAVEQPAGAQREQDEQGEQQAPHGTGCIAWTGARPPSPIHQRSLGYPAGQLGRSRAEGLRHRLARLPGRRPGRGRQGARRRGLGMAPDRGGAGSRRGGDGRDLRRELPVQELELLRSLLERRASGHRALLRAAPRVGGRSTACA